MTQTTRPGRSQGAAVGFADARAAADRAETVQRTQAARTVLDNSVDASDCRELLLMLGLPDPEPIVRTPARTRDEHAGERRHDDTPAMSHQAGVRE